MRRHAALILIASLLSTPFAISAFGGQLEDAIAAYKRGDYKTAYQLYKPLAEEGNPEAQSDIGYMYQVGCGVPQNDVEAVNWYRKAAEQGFAKAQYNLGSMCINGRGVPQFGHGFRSSRLMLGLSSITVLHFPQATVSAMLSILLDSSTSGGSFKSNWDGVM